MEVEVSLYLYQEVADRNGIVGEHVDGRIFNQKPNFNYKLNLGDH